MYSTIISSAASHCIIMGVILYVQIPDISKCFCQLLLTDAIFSNRVLSFSAAIFSIITLDAIDWAKSSCRSNAICFFIASVSCKNSPDSVTFQLNDLGSSFPYEHIFLTKFQQLCHLVRKHDQSKALLV